MAASTWCPPAAALCHNKCKACAAQHSAAQRAALTFLAPSGCGTKARGDTFLDRICTLESRTGLGMSHFQRRGRLDMRSKSGTLLRRVHRCRCSACAAPGWPPQQTCLRACRPCAPGTAPLYQQLVSSSWQGSWLAASTGREATHPCKHSMPACLRAHKVLAVQAQPHLLQDVGDFLSLGHGAKRLLRWQQERPAELNELWHVAG